MRKLKVGVDSYSLKPLDLSPFELLEWAAVNGADGVQFSEINVPAGTAIDRAFLADLRSYAEGNNLYIEWGGGEHIPLDLETGKRKDILAGNRRAAEQAFHMGSSTVRSCSGGLMRWKKDAPATEAFLRSMADALRAQKPMFRDFGVVLAIETHFEFTSFELLRLFDMCGAVPGEYLGICLDTMNLLTMLEDPVLATRRLLPWVVTTHIKDGGLLLTADGFVSFTAEAGKGIVDLAAIFETLAAVHPGITLTVEDHGGDFLIPVNDPEFLARFPDLAVPELVRLLGSRGRNAGAHGRGQAGRPAARPLAGRLRAPGQARHPSGPAHHRRRPGVVRDGLARGLQAPFGRRSPRRGRATRCRRPLERRLLRPDRSGGPGRPEGPEPPGCPAHGRGRRRARRRALRGDPAPLPALRRRRQRAHLVRGDRGPSGRALQSRPAPPHGANGRRLRPARRRDPRRREKGVGRGPPAPARPAADLLGPFLQARGNAPAEDHPAQSPPRSPARPAARLPARSRRGARLGPGRLRRSGRSRPPRRASTASTSRPATATLSPKPWPPTTARTAVTAARSRTGRACFSRPSGSSGTRSRTALSRAGSRRRTPSPFPSASVWTPTSRRGSTWPKPGLSSGSSPAPASASWRCPWASRPGNPTSAVPTTNRSRAAGSPASTRSKASPAISPSRRSCRGPLRRPPSSAPGIPG
ncbi:MAG: TIM barrel protein [Candidatus Moduliflexus flocculans]|nr:TIM barrel protein [Candidatus Moduliflexus flocculans]